tara:strand:- start:152 stop:1069 length:918 start_codon:yes stop_codon:yes gene_type:complete
MTRRDILCFGGGVDSTALLAIHFDRDRASRMLGIERKEIDRHLPHFDYVVHADTGFEWPITVENVEYAKQECESRGMTLKVVRDGKHERGILDWCLHTGSIPLLPGARHACSNRFKRVPINRWAKDKWGKGAKVGWILGIEANEGYRSKRFNVTKGELDNSGLDIEQYYPMGEKELNIDRDAAKAFLREIEWPYIHKSSCMFCPFMKPHEIFDVIENEPESWDLVKQVEAQFKETSPAKHQRYLDAAPNNRVKPTEKHPDGIRAKQGMWSVDYYNDENDPARLFAKRINGRRLSVEEWEERAKAQ